MPTWTLSKEFRFEAAHRLPHHEGQCRRLHGHSWVARVFVAAAALQQYTADAGPSPRIGMVMDYGDIKQAMKPLLDSYLDHYYLNESIPALESPTSETLAQWIYNQLRPHLPGLVAVEIDETCTSRCRYEEGSALRVTDGFLDTLRRSQEAEQPLEVTVK